MNDNAVEKFCGSKLFNTYEDFSKLNFTACFQKTVLYWLPCSYFYLISPFWICFLIKKIQKQNCLTHSYSMFFYMKIVYK